MVKCSECGFLALRNVETRGLDEAEESFRRQAIRQEYSKSHPIQITNTPFYRDEELTRYVHETWPVCFARICNFWDLCTEASTEDKSTTSEDFLLSENALLTVINTERQCESFTKWQQGFTPKEHQEMIDREARLKWQAEREEADKKWRAKQEWRLVIMGGIIAGIFTLLGAGIGVFLTILLK